MRWSLLWCNLMTVLVSSVAVVEKQADSADESVEPVDPVETVEEQDRIVDQKTTPANRVLYYEPGTDFLRIPELYRNIKAGKNTSGLYIGPTFSKEFMIKTPSGKRVTTGFKLLDWKRRRKRLNRKCQKRCHDSVKTGDRIKKECPGTKDKAVTDSENRTNSNFKKNNKTQESINLVKSKDERKNRCASKSLVKKIKDNALPLVSSIEYDNNDGKMKRDNTKVYTQPCCDETGICLNPLRDNDTMLTRLPDPSLSFYNQSEGRKCRKRKNTCIRNRRKREEKARINKLVVYNRTMRVKDFVDYSSTPEAISRTASTLTIRQESIVSFNPTQDPVKLTTKKTSQSTNSELLFTKFTTVKYDNTISLMKKEVQNNEANLQNSTNKDDLTSKAKAKIFINGEEMPVHKHQKQTCDKQEVDFPKQKLNYEEPQVEEPLTTKLNSKETQEHDLQKQKSATVDHKVAAVIFACVTPPLPTTGSMLGEIDEQRAECHPKGSGPLSPISFDPEAYGPRNEEEVEDALTGKLADRVVEVVMAKVGKAPRMLKELGLYAQGNLTKIQSTISHPEGKQSCKEQSSETLKLSVLEDIETAVEKLASTKSNGMCLKPPEDLADFLSWLLSEDSEMDMPDSALHLTLAPRREADYLFRSSGAIDDFLNEVKDIDHKCNWDNWMSFVEDSPSGLLNDKSAVTEVFEGKGHVQQEKNFKRMPRHLTRRKRIMKKPGEHGRRRRYTPWSLKDYP